MTVTFFFLEDWNIIFIYIFDNKKAKIWILFAIKNKHPDFRKKIQSLNFMIKINKSFVN